MVTYTHYIIKIAITDMNKKGIIAIVAVIIIIVLGILFLGNDRSVPVDTSTDEDEGAITSAVPANLISPTLLNEGAVATIDCALLGES